MMERSEIMTTMGGLKLFGMRAAYDEVVATAVKRQHEPQRVVSDLLTAELSEKQARSIKYQIAIAKLPMAKEIDEFAFDGTPINDTLVRDLAGGGFLARATWSWSAAPAPAKPISPSASRAPASAAAHVAASSTSSTSSTGSRPRPAPADRAASPTTSAAWTSLVGETVHWTVS